MIIMISRILKWVALSFACFACALAAKAGSVLGAVSALLAGALGFLAVVYAKREHAHD